MSIKQLNFAQVQELLAENDQVVYLDVRSVPEFAAGHPEGAYNIPLLHPGPAGMEPNPDFVEDVSRHFGRDRPLLLACRAGVRSARAAAALATAGFQELHDYIGGYGGGNGDPGWVACGGKTTTTPEAGRTYEDLKA